MLEQLAFGFSVALEPQHLMLLLVGALAGTLIGVLPGLGPTGTIALILPIAYGLDATSLIIVMAAVYYGAMYGGSTTSILLNIPGESASVVTAIDGNQRAKKGLAGPALAISAIGSFVAGTAAIVLLMLFAPIITDWALKFGPPEYTGLLIFGLSTVVALTGRSLIKGLLSLLLGLGLSTVGIDPITGYDRFTGGNLWLADGIEFAVVAVGLFAVPEVLDTVRELMKSGQPPTRIALGRVWISWKELAYSKWAIVRGSMVGFAVGVLPGAGATIASFLSYNLERRVASHPERYGTGDIRGVAAPESANNGASGGSLVPLLTLGIPGSSSTALMLAALLIGGVTPGPGMMEKHPDVFWGLVASMYMGNIMLLIINFPMIPLWVRVLDLPARFLLPIVMVISVVGVYGIKYSPVDLLLLPVFGALGLYMRNRDFPLAPVVLGLVLGPMLERSFRQSLIVSDGDPSIFVSHPISATLLLLALVSLVGPGLLRLLRRTRSMTMV
ncbi:MAG TPA: tripartite tricarboxylate transporter permease [Dongiaceae bacterium]|nr:tripartite tricarboxylate transporter permease [Dongiaceae bacterium]